MPDLMATISSLLVVSNSRTDSELLEAHMTEELLTTFASGTRILKCEGRISLMPMTTPLIEVQVVANARVLFHVPRSHNALGLFRPRMAVPMLVL